MNRLAGGLCIWVAASGILMGVARPGWAYRPFDSTWAEVEEPKEVELQVGYFNLKRNQKENTFIVPKTELEVGLFDRVHASAEFQVEKTAGEQAQFADPELMVKGILKEGVLQEKAGVSVGMEAGPLIPSTEAGQRKFGFEGRGIVSAKLAPFLIHLNAGGGVDRADRHPFALWGMIGELPVARKVRLVGEINGMHVRTQSADVSALLGVIWKSPWNNLAFDAGVRRGITHEATDWLVTTGLTYEFSFAKDRARTFSKR